MQFCGVLSTRALFSSNTSLELTTLIYHLQHVSNNGNSNQIHLDIQISFPSSPNPSSITSLNLLTLLSNTATSKSLLWVTNSNFVQKHYNIDTLCKFILNERKRMSQMLLRFSIFVLFYFFPQNHLLHIYFTILWRVFCSEVSYKLHDFFSANTTNSSCFSFNF